MVAVLVWVGWATIAANLAVILWCAAVAWAQMRVARQQYRREAHELGEIAELEMSWQLPTAPSSPVFRRPR